MTDVASQVPAKFDVIINGNGFVFWNGLLDSRPFRNQRAAYSYSKTFVERQNVSGNYGDSQQDFWLTASQNDWSLGEGQKFLRLNDQDSRRKFYQGTNIDVTLPGQVTLRPTTTSLSFAASVNACFQNGNAIVTTSTTNLYSTDLAGAITDLGAHGVGAAPGRHGITRDDVGALFITGTTGVVRKYAGASFSTFSASGADSLAFLNNTLYGFRVATADLVSYDTAGTLTSIYTVKGAAGTAASVGIPRLVPFGGQLLIVLTDRIYIYDGTSTSLIAQFAQNFVASDAAVLDGVLYIGGFFQRPNAADGSTKFLRPAVRYYLNGTIGTVWKSDTLTASSTDTAYGGVTLTPYQDGIAFTDDTNGHLMFYQPDMGAISCLSTYTVAGSSPRLAANGNAILHTRTQTTAYLWPSTTTATSGTLTGSLIDYESSLNKLIRGVTVDFDAASDGDGGSVDIAYQTNSVTGSFTTLQTGAVSGTEYTLTGVTGRSVGVKLTLNKGTSTSGPVLKRMFPRSVPVQQTYRRCQYVLDLTGTAKNPVVLRDGTPHNLTGAQMAANLITAITAGTPITVTDRFGTYTAVFEQGEGVTELDEVRPGEFIAQVTLRGV